MNGEINEENLTKLLLEFGEKMHGDDQVQKLVDLANFSIILLTTVISTLTDSRKEAQKGIEEAFKDCKDRIDSAYGIWEGHKGMVPN